MKVLAGLVTQGTGSLGGMTMSKNKQGYYLRSRTVPTNPKTPKQMAIRTGLASLATNWQLLTSSQQAAWNLYGKNVHIVLDNGQTKILSGFNWYIACNQYLLQVGDTPVADAPTTYSLAGTPTILAWGYAGPSEIGINLTVLDPPATAGTGDQVMLFIGRPVSPGKAYFSGPWQYIGAFDTFLLPSGIDTYLGGASAYAASGTQVQWLRAVRILPDGRYSTPTQVGPVQGDGAVSLYGFDSQVVSVTVAHGAAPDGGNLYSTGVVTTARIILPGAPDITAVPGTGEAGPDVELGGLAPATPGTYIGFVEVSGSLGLAQYGIALTVT